MYKLIGFSVLSASKNSSWATITEATLSLTYNNVSYQRMEEMRILTGPFKQMIRSFNKREKIS